MYTERGFRLGFTAGDVLAFIATNRAEKVLAPN